MYLLWLLAAQQHVSGLTCATGGSQTYASFTTFPSITCPSSTKIAKGNEWHPSISRRPTPSPTVLQYGGGPYCVIMYTNSSRIWNGAGYAWYLDCSASIDGLYLDVAGKPLSCDEGPGCASFTDTEGIESKYCCCKYAMCNLEVDNICKPYEHFVFDKYGRSVCKGYVNEEVSGGSPSSFPTAIICVAAAILLMNVFAWYVYKRRHKQPRFEILDEASSQMHYMATDPASPPTLRRSGPPSNVMLPASFHPSELSDDSAKSPVLWINNSSSSDQSGWSITRGVFRSRLTKPPRITVILPSSPRSGQKRIIHKLDIDGHRRSNRIGTTELTPAPVSDVPPPCPIKLLHFPKDAEICL